MIRYSEKLGKNITITYFKTNYVRKDFTNDKLYKIVQVQQITKTSIQEFPKNLELIFFAIQK